MRNRTSRTRGKAGRKPDLSQFSKWMIADIRGAHGMVCSFYLNLCKSDHREGGITFETAKAANFNTNVSQTPVGSVESPAI